MKFSALKLLLFFFSIFVLLGFLVKPAQAQTDYETQPSSSAPTSQTTTGHYTAPNTEDDVPNNLHTYSQNVLIEVMAAVACQLTGIDPSNLSQKCLGINPSTGKIGYAGSDGGAIGFMGNMIAVLYEPPAHVGDYVQNLAQDFGITNKTYARQIDIVPTLKKPSTTADTRGIGFEGLSPLLNIWKAFRDIAYLLFVLVFIILGVAIMLRVKIDPRTVMSIQNQIPKVIIGILLVTFSFAIAGFLIDVMWIAIYLFYGAFANINIAPEGAPAVLLDVSQFSPQNITGTTPLGAIGGFGGIGDLSRDGSGAIKSVISSLFSNSAGSIVAAILGGLIGTASCAATGLGLLISPICGLIGAGAGAAIGGSLISTIGGFIAFIIIAVALLWALIRVWFILLMAYIMILLDVVFAPFWIIGGIFPGSKISFSGWLRDLVGNLAAFPAVFVMFLLGKTFIVAFASGPGEASNFLPPFIGNPTDYKSFGALIGLGIILTTPNAVKMMKSVFGAPQIDVSSIGQAVSAGAAAPGRLIGGGASAIFTPHYNKEGTKFVYPGGPLGKAIRAFGLVR
ncbi:MAG: hypothetical protein AAB521_01825 [Patescibacteria group bacterium]